MSGHSKWHSIKHKKSAIDAKRGKLFSRLIKELTVAARFGGGDVNSNPRLRTVVMAAKSANMPLDNIQRAIKKGTGELPGTTYEEYKYEGYGPGGIAIMLETLTDNKNRTTAELRHVFSRQNGNLGADGCVSWMFETKGLIMVELAAISEDDLMALVLDLGAEDMEVGTENYEIKTHVDDFEKVKTGLEEKKIPINYAQITKIPTATKKLEGKEAEQALKLMNALEDHDDVQNVYSNFDIDDSIIEELM